MRRMVRQDRAHRMRSDDARVSFHSTPRFVAVPFTDSGRRGTSQFHDDAAEWVGCDAYRNCVSCCCTRACVYWFYVCVYVVCLFVSFAIVLWPTLLSSTPTVPVP